MPLSVNRRGTEAEMNFTKTYESTNEIATVVRLEETSDYGRFENEWVVTLYATGGVEIQNSEDGSIPLGGTFLAIETEARKQVAR
jgi:hypothetical protein